MASITIRRLDEAVKAKLQVRATRHGRSVEAEAREILEAELKENVREKAEATEGLGTAIRRYFEPLGGMELDIPPRQAVRPPPKFDE